MFHSNVERKDVDDQKQCRTASFAIVVLGGLKLTFAASLNDKQQESNDSRPSRNSCHWCVAQDLAKNAFPTKKPVRLVVPSRIRLVTLRLSSRLSSLAWVSSVFAICCGNGKARRSTSVYTRIGWVLFVIWQFVPASMWTRTATPAQTRATKVAEFTDVAQKAGLTA